MRGSIANSSSSTTGHGTNLVNEHFLRDGQGRSARDLGVQEVVEEVPARPVNQGPERRQLEEAGQVKLLLQERQPDDEA